MEQVNRVPNTSPRPMMAAGTAIHQLTWRPMAVNNPRPAMVPTLWGSKTLISRL